MTSAKPPVVLAPIEARLLTKAEAAAYCGLTQPGYDRHRKAGNLPGYVPGMARFDRRAIDAALDDLSKLGKLIAPTPVAPEPEEDSLEAYKRKRLARKAAESRQDEAIRNGVATVTKQGRGGKQTTIYIHRATGKRLPSNPKSEAFRVAFEPCEQDAAVNTKHSPGDKASRS